MPRAPSSNSPESPKLKRLLRKVQSGDKTAVAGFWKHVAKIEAPLIERLRKTESKSTSIIKGLTQSLVTFIWRGNRATRNVVLLQELSDAHYRARLTRLPGTDIWYRSYRIRNDLRTRYSFVINEPHPPEHRMSQTDWDGYKFLCDPHNPRRLGDWASVLEMPFAQQQPLLTERHATPHGTLTTHSVRSRILKNKRDITVYQSPAKPVDLAGGCLLILFDGDDYRTQIPVPIILDNLFADAQIPPVTAVFVPPYPGRRLQELVGGERFLQFVAHELMPWISTTFGLKLRPARTVIGGLSAGGLAATHAALLYPHLFGKVLSQSGSFQTGPVWKPDHADPTLAPSEWMSSQALQMPRKKVTFYLEVGLLESGQQPGIPGLLFANRHLRDVLRLKRYTVHYSEFPGGHDFANWRTTFPVGLLALIGRRTK